MKLPVYYLNGKFRYNPEPLPDENYGKYCHSFLQCDSDYLSYREQFCGCWGRYSQDLQHWKDSTLEVKAQADINIEVWLQHTSPPIRYKNFKPTNDTIYSIEYEGKILTV